MPHSFSTASHYTLSLSADMPLIEECNFHVAKPQTGRYNDQFRYISVSQGEDRQYGNLGLIGAKSNARLSIVNVDGNSITVRLRSDRHGNEHPLLHALNVIEQKVIEAYGRDAKDGKTLGPVVRVPSQAGHDHLVKLKRLHATVDPKGEQVFEQSLEVTRYIVSVQKITYYKGQPYISLVLKSAKLSLPSTPPRAIRETPQSLLDLMEREAESDNDQDGGDNDSGDGGDGENNDDKCEVGGNCAVTK